MDKSTPAYPYLSHMYIHTSPYIYAYKFAAGQAGQQKMGSETIFCLFFLLFLLSTPNSTLHLQCQLPHPASSVTFSLNLEGQNSAWGRG